MRITKVLHENNTVFRFFGTNQYKRECKTKIGMKYIATKTIVFSLFSIGIGLLTIVSEEYKTLMISAFFLFAIGYLIYHMYTNIFVILDKNTETIKQLNEKLNIHKDLIDIKATLRNLEKEVFKHE